MAQVLGRVTGRGLDGPRGPDVTHRIKVPRAWLDSGGLIEVELPRHLRCAACEGGGCDACERSGALTVRGRKDPAEILEVTLPRLGAEAQGESRPFVIRIPEQGGLPRDGEDLPRGLLLLGVEAADTADTSVRLVRRSRSSELMAHSGAPARPSTPPRELKRAALIAIMVLVWVLLLLWLRLTGRG